MKLFSNFIDFRNIVIKSFQIDSKDKVDDVTDIEDDEIINLISSISQILSKNRNSAIDKNNQSNLSLASRSTRNCRLSIKYQNFVDVIVLFQNEIVSSSFMKSRRKEVNELLKKECFEVVFIESIFESICIFNSRFVDKIKHEKTTAIFEKSRLIVQIYNDHDKTIILTQISIMQRMNQRFILTLIVSIDHNLYL